ncbi:MAG: penicillin-binding protein activator LpoB [Pseudomonadota bacterium]
MSWLFRNKVGSTIKTRRVLLMVLALLVSVLVLGGCSSAPTVERKAVDEDIDLSGRWNDVDSRMVSREMIPDCLNRPWRTRFMSENGGKMPTVIVGAVKNRSHEHINVLTFTKDMERELINSGLVQFVASAGERVEVRDERVDQAQNATEETMKGAGKEIGADFMLIGTINTIADTIQGKSLMYYQVNLELIDMRNNIKAWIGETKVKKVVTKPGVKW